MKSLKQIMGAALLTAATMTSGYSQMAYNCEGCPPLAQRPVINLSTVADAQGNLPANYLMSCENLYVLDKKIYAPIGSQVTILAGTVIKGVPNPDPANANAFIVPRGAKVFANGSECCPIIFTAMADNLDGTYPIFTKEQWGGVIMLGRAHNTINRNEVNPENPIFIAGGPTDGIGIIEGTDPAEARNWYGAEITQGVPFNNFDNSGVLTYVSIRHGGAIVGANNEINALTLGSVGSGTVLRYIEVVSNGDDGIEFFGGTVDLKYARVLYCEDDYLDWDQGYTGRIQHVVGIQRPSGTLAGGSAAGDHGIEADGDDGTKYARAWLSDPIVSNVTMIGNRAAGAGRRALELKERTKGEIYNSIFANFPTGINYANANLNPVVLRNNTFVNMGTNITGTPPAGFDPTQVAWNNTFVASLSGMTFSTWTTAWDAIPNSSGTAFNVKGLSDDPVKVAADWYKPGYYNWFDGVDYRGAYKPGASPWWSHANCSMMQGARSDFESLTFFPAVTDINGDGVTNAGDLSVLIGRYNKANNQ